MGKFIISVHAYNQPTKPPDPKPKITPLPPNSSEKVILLQLSGVVCPRARLCLTYWGNLYSVLDRGYFISVRMFLTLLQTTPLPIIRQIV